MFTPFAFVKSAAAAGGNLLLDLYPGAEYAYSTRKLNSSYTGDCMIVSGSAGTQSIGFDSNGNLNTGSIISTYGSSSVRVMTWFDQSGNGFNVTQSNFANAPFIQSASVITTITSGCPALYFTASRMLGETSVNFTGSDPISVFTIDKVPATNVSYVVWNQGSSTGGSPAGAVYGIRNLSSNTLQAYTAYGTSYSPNTTNAKAGAGVRRFSGGEWKQYAFLNSAAGGSNPESAEAYEFDKQINVGANASDAQRMLGYIGEIIVYKADQLTNVTNIYNNQDTYYNLP
jgi:hypothetical protein